MAEQTSGNGKGPVNGLLLQGAKWLILALSSVSLTVASITGNRLLAQMDKMDTKVESLTIDMATVKTDIRYLRRKVDP